MFSLNRIILKFEIILEISKISQGLHDYKPNTFLLIFSCCRLHTERSFLENEKLKNFKSMLMENIENLRIIKISRLKSLVVKVEEMQQQLCEADSAEQRIQSQISNLRFHLLAHFAEADTTTELVHESLRARLIDCNAKLQKAERQVRDMLPELLVTITEAKAINAEADFLRERNCDLREKVDALEAEGHRLRQHIEILRLQEQVWGHGGCAVIGCIFNAVLLKSIVYWVGYFQRSIPGTT